MITYKSPTIHEAANLQTMFKAVAAQGGLARKEDEISESYINEGLAKALSHGFIMCAYNNKVIVGCLQAFRLEPRAFAHVLSDLTVAVHPDYQGKGIGSTLFKKLFEYVEADPKLARIELMARESNTQAIALYKRLGFEIEGILKNRIAPHNQPLQADVSMAWLKK